MQSYICKCCGAEIITNEETNFTICLYCGNSIAVTKKEYNDLNIKKIIPFSVEKEEATRLFKKLIKRNILDAKKIYVPVRLCSFEFDFLMYYQYREEHTDSDGNTTYTYIDTEDLIDGKVNKEVVFGNSKIRSVHLIDEIMKNERLNYDPVLLKDVSIEASKFEKDEKFLNGLEEKTRVFSRGRINRDICIIYSENYFVSSVELESFSTLLPVYIIKSSDGQIYNMPGVNIKDKYKKIKKKQNISLFFSILFTLYILYRYFETNNVLMVIPFMIGVMTVVYILKKPRLKDLKYTNYEYKKYSYGSKRKNLKY